jgi:peptide/nickel transport system substrate-binding protein
MFMRKIFVALTLTLIIAALLSACSPTSAPSPSSSLSPATRAAPSAPATSVSASSVAPSLTATPAAKPTTADQPQYGGTLVLIETNTVSNLGLPYDGGAGFAEYVTPTYESLLRYDGTGDYKPCLATSWQIAPDSKSITFILRKGVKFHDGTDFNAEALKYNMGRVTSGAVPSRVTSIDILDDYTVRFNLSQYDVKLLQELCFRQGNIASPTAAQKKPSPENAAKEQFIGTGPFKFVDWKRDVNARFEKFNDYWDKGKPYLDKIEIRTVADPITALMVFEAGEGQVIMTVSPKTASELKAKGYVVSSNPSIIKTLIPDGTNRDSPFADKRVRQAVEYALNKTDLVNHFGYGLWAGVNQFFNSGETGYLNDVQPRSYNVQQAKQLLAAAGYGSGFKMTLTGQISDQKDVLVALQAALADIGITAEIKTADRGVWTSMAQNGWQNGIVLSSLGVAYPPSNRMYFLTPYSTSIPNKSIYMPSGFMAQYDQMVGTADLQKYNGMVSQLCKQLFDETMIIPLWTEPQIAVSQKNVHNLNACTDATPMRWIPGGGWLSK